MSLSASSSLAEIHAQYVANRLYALEGSKAMGVLFSEACAWLLIKPVRSEDRDGSFQFDLGQVRDEQQACDSWLGQFAPATPAGSRGRVTKASFEYFRY